MKRWMLTCVFLVWRVLSRLTRVADEQPHFYLSPGETMLVSTEKYFTGAYESLFLEGERKGQARIYSESSAEEVLSVFLESDHWRFGPALGDLFTIVYGSRLEVWTLQQLTLIQAFEADIAGVAAVQSLIAKGFVFWTPEGVFYINLLSRVLVALPITGIRTVDVSHIVVCASADRLLTSQGTQEQETLTLYSVDYNALQATPVPGFCSFKIPGTLVDGQCRSSFVLLSATAFYVGDNLFMRERKVPSHIGRVKQVKTLDEVNAILLLGEEAAALISTSDNFFQLQCVLPGATLVTQLRPGFVYVKEGRLMGSLKSCNAQISLQHTAITDLLELQQVILGKRGREVVALRVNLAPYRLSLTGQDSPYQVGVCTNAADCITVSVSPISASGTEIVPLRNRTVYVENALSEWKVRMFVSLSQWFAGPNIKAQITFPDIIPHVSVEIKEDSASRVIRKHILDLLEPETLFLCGSTADQAFVFAKAQLLIRYIGNAPKIPPTGFDQHNKLATNLTDLSCAVQHQQVYICGQDETGEWQLLSWSFQAQLTIAPLPSACRRILAGRDKLVLVLAGEVRVKSALDDWAKIAEGSQWLGADLRNDDLAVYSESVLQVFSLSRNMSVGTAEAPWPFAQLLYADNSLVTLHSNNTLTLYHVVSPFSLLRAFSLDIGCSMKSAVLSREKVYIHCGSYIQVVSLTERKQCAALVRTPVLEPGLYSYLLANEELIEALECFKTYCTSTTSWFDPSTGYWLVVELGKAVEVSGSLSLLGEMQVGNTDHSVTSGLNATLVDHGAVVTASPFPSELEVAEALFIGRCDLFRGEVLHLSVAPDTAGVEVIPATQEIGCIAVESIVYTFDPQLSFYFSAESGSLVSFSIECKNEKCSKILIGQVHLDEIKLFLIESINFLFTIERKIYLLVSGTSTSGDYPVLEVTAIITFDVSNRQFHNVFVRKETGKLPPYHIIKESANKYHLFFCSTYLEHCVVSLTAIDCADIAVEGGVLVVSSEALSSNSWRVYAINTHFLLQYELAAGLQFLSAQRINIPLNSIHMRVIAIGNRAVVLDSERAEMYSLPAFQRIHTIAVLTGSLAYDYWRMAEDYDKFLLIRSRRKGVVLDLNAPRGCEVAAFLTLNREKMVGPREFAGLTDYDCCIQRLARAGIAVQPGETRSFTVSATGVFGTVGHTLHTHSGSWSVWVLWPVAVSALCWVYCRRRRTLLAVREVEMEAMTVPSSTSD